MTRKVESRVESEVYVYRQRPKVVTVKQVDSNGLVTGLFDGLQYCFLYVPCVWLVVAAAWRKEWVRLGNSGERDDKNSPRGMIVTIKRRNESEVN